MPIGDNYPWVILVRAIIEIVLYTGIAGLG